MTQGLEQKEFWEEAWQRHIEKYLTAAPRTGHWLNTHLKGAGASSLEIAGGSCRDSRYLASAGWRATATDFDGRTISYLKEKFKGSPLELKEADAFALPFPDKTFDVSFHNGFWVLFQDNEKIKTSFLEQVRVTSKYIVVFVHNAENKGLADSFREKSREDKLYDIRFFSRQELFELVTSFGVAPDAISMKKFGGPADQFYWDRVKGMPNPLKWCASSFVPRLYSLQPWSKVERIACVIRMS